MKETKYIIQVAPVIPLPVLRTQIFSYWHFEPLPVGTLVSAPFYFREIRGIVVGVKKSNLPKDSLKLKNINSIIEKRFLSVPQVALARQIAEYYFSPLGSVLKLLIPKNVKLRAKKEPKIGLPAPHSTARRSGEIALKILKSDEKKFLLVGSAKEREKIVVDLIRECLKKNKQCLILVPEVFFLQGSYQKLQAVFSEEIAFVSGRTTKGQFFEWWKKIKDGRLKIVMASKLGIFLPFFDLGIVIVREEQDISFKQWKAMPRYSAVRGAEFLADISDAKLVLESSAPSVENFYRAGKGEIELVEAEKEKNRFPKLEIIQLESEKRNPDFPVSKALYSRLAEIVNNKKQAVIFVNRRGFSTRTICENCKKILRCPKCGPALIFSEDKGQYRCLHCAYKMDLLSACPSCGGYQFSHRGIGTQTVEKKIKRLFPSARVARIDADTLRSVAKYKDIMQKFSRGEIDILVGTQAVIKGIYSGNIRLAASISGQDFADGIEFNSRAQALSRIFHMANLLNKEGVLAVQSFFGGNPLFEYLEKNDLKKYYDQELAVRKKFAYPPFRKFVRLAYRDKSEKKAAGEAKKAFDLLRRAGNNEVEIIGPYEPAGQKKGVYQRNILLKIDPEKNVGDFPARSVLGGFRKGWSVDVDPVLIF